MAMKYKEDFIKDVFKLKKQGLSNRKIAKILIGRDSAQSTIFDILARGFKEKPQLKMLFLDVEVSASVVLSFPRFKSNISPDAVIKEPYMLTYAGCWEDGKVFSKGLHQTSLFKFDHSNDYELISDLWQLLDEADYVVAHNARFDVGWFNQRCAYWGLCPPSPYKVICTVKALKSAFTLPSNSLSASTNYFELERKLSHEGIGLWKRCMEGDVVAFEEMVKYNKGDIPTLVGIYNKVRPFMKNHPNVAITINDSILRCGTCGSSDLKELKGKKASTNLSSFDTYRCNSCGSVKRSRKNTRSSQQMNNTLMNT